MAAAARLARVPEVVLKLAAGVLLHDAKHLVLTGSIDALGEVFLVILAQDGVILGRPRVVVPGHRGAAQKKRAKRQRSEKCKLA